MSFRSDIPVRGAAAFGPDADLWCRRLRLTDPHDGAMPPRSRLAQVNIAPQRLRAAAPQHLPGSPASTNTLARQRPCPLIPR